MRSNPVASGQRRSRQPVPPGGNLASLYGEDAHGKWTLKVTNSGRPAHLECLTFDMRARCARDAARPLGGVTATVTYTERNFSYEKLRLKIVRSGAPRWTSRSSGPAARTARASGRPWSGA
jgi:hypothetical protein